MRKTTWAILGVGLAAFLAFYLLVPKTAVEADWQVCFVERDGKNITDQLSAGQLADLERLAREVKCTRWKNPAGAVPLRADTIELGGLDGSWFILAGSADRYVYDDFALRDGGAFLNAVLDVIGRETP